MNDLQNRIEIAKQSNAELEKLLIDYLPFIKKQLAVIIGLEYDDKLSLAMITFINCIKQYDNDKGNFLKFVQVSIKNRMIDELRKEQRHSKKMISMQNDDSTLSSIEYSSSLLNYNHELEKQAISDEIDRLSMELKCFNIAFHELPKICPKQNRTKEQCIQIAKAIIANDKMKAMFIGQHKIPQSELAELYKISSKTIEKHRKYIVTLSVILLGEYPCISAFLPQYGKVKS